MASSLPARTKITPSTVKNVWGIYDDKLKPVLDIDSCLDVSYTGAMKVSSFPVEKGGFISYNKVREPYKAKVKVAVGGKSARIEKLLKDLETLLSSTTLYRIVTPEMTYLNATVEHYSYKRAEKDGRNMITAELEIMEVREVTPQYTTVALPAAKAKKAGDASKVNGGKVQGQTPDQQQESDASKLSHSEMFAKYYAKGAGG
jgi:hypothetical protein